MLGMDKKSSRNGTNTVETLIGPRVVIRGDVQFSGGLYVEGKIIGKISAAGSLQGDIHASERVELSPTAKIQGNVHYKVVEMTAGATLTGRLIHADAPMSEQTDKS